MGLSPVGPTGGRRGDVVFVVSTGRCGSTLVSDLLRRHPEVLSLSELFGQLYPFPFAPDEMCTGADFWAWLSEPNPLATLLLRNGAEPEELLYPEDGKRFDRRHGIPAILTTTLPHLVDGDADTKFDHLAASVVTWGAATVAAQFDHLFDDLDRHRLAGRVRVERSGASLLFVGDLLHMFPGARFIHLYRSGMDTAWSMSRHSMYRLIRRVETLRSESTGEDTVLLRVHDRYAWRSLCEGLGPLDLAEDPPVSWYGAFWSRMVMEGLRRLQGLPPDRLLTINYEFLAGHPTETASVIADFLGVVPTCDWIDAGCELVRTPRQGAWRTADPTEQQHLVQACAPGTRQLRRFLRAAPPWSRPPTA